jgi:hypothetical protein
VLILGSTTVSFPPQILPGEPGQPLRPYLPAVSKHAWHLDKAVLKGVKKFSKTLEEVPRGAENRPPPEAAAAAAQEPLAEQAPPPSPPPQAPAADAEPQV